MRPYLELLRRYPQSKGSVVLSFQDGMVVSWALVFKGDEPRTDNSTLNWYMGSNPDANHMFIYTRRSHRRMGYGTEVYQQVLKDFGKVKTYPHDEASMAFFRLRERV
jgi:hypothetical protein